MAMKTGVNGSALVTAGILDRRLRQQSETGIITKGIWLPTNELERLFAVQLTRAMSQCSRVGFNQSDRIRWRWEPDSSKTYPTSRRNQQFLILKTIKSKWRACCPPNKNQPNRVLATLIASRLLTISSQSPAWQRASICPLATE